MNLDHVQEVRARIDELRNRFTEFDRPVQSADAVQPKKSFTDVLRESSESENMPCPAELEPMISVAAEKYGVPAAVIKGIIRAESGFRTNAVSRVGAKGLMQLMPGTAHALGVDPMSPEQNIDGGTRYIKQQIDKFGNLEHALAAYNAGSGAVQRYGGVPPYKETRRYVAEVLRNIDKYSGKE